MTHTTREAGAAFADVVYADQQWADAEFDALISASFSEPPAPPRPAPPRVPPHPGTPPPPSRRPAPGQAAQGRRDRQAAPDPGQRQPPGQADEDQVQHPYARACDPASSATITTAILPGQPVMLRLEPGRHLPRNEGRLPASPTSKS